MNKPPHAELEPILKFVASFLGEATPRSLVVLGAARLEEEVREILELAAPGLDSEYRAHALRVDILSSMGILSEGVAFSLKKIARIRNHFAHKSEAVGLCDAKIAAEVQALNEKLEQMVRLSKLSTSFFDQLKGKIPRGQPPATWIDDGFQKYQTAIVVLLWHLTVVRYNIPPRSTPIELSEKGYW
jgi:hypothetical protein